MHMGELRDLGVLGATALLIFAGLLCLLIWMAAR